MSDSVHEVLVIGAGPAGLGVGARLRQRGRRALLLEAGEGAGARWRKHYDRLHLHTLGRTSGLPGKGYPKSAGRYPSRDAVANYLEDYARHFDLELRSGVRVRGAQQAERRWELSTDVGPFSGRALVLACGAANRARRIEWEGHDDFQGTLVHSSEYKSGATYRGQAALVVGTGNSGAEIALDLVEHGAGPVYLSARGPVHVLPRDPFGLPSNQSAIQIRNMPMAFRDGLAGLISRLYYGDLSAYGFRRPEIGIVSQTEKLGRAPMLDLGTMRCIKKGQIEVVPEVEGLSESEVVLRGGRRIEVGLIVQATGFEPGLEGMVEGLELDERGLPPGRNGSCGLPGLYAVGYQESAVGRMRFTASKADEVAAAIDAYLG